MAGKFLFNLVSFTKFIRGHPFWALLLAPIIYKIWDASVSHYIEEIGADKGISEGVKQMPALVSWYMAEIQPVIAWLGGDFGYGFLFATLLWMPKYGAIRDYIRVKRAERKPFVPDKDTDSRLAERCEELAQEFLELKASLELMQSENHWRAASSAEDARSDKRWYEMQQQRVKDLHKFRLKWYKEFAGILSQLRERPIIFVGMPESIEIEQHNLKVIGDFLIDVAQRLRTGNYIGAEIQSELNRWW